MADDEMKLNSIIVWCATHPDEVPLAIHLLLPAGNLLPASRNKPEVAG